MGQKTRVRRSSTGRSIGNRSSFNVSANGEEDGQPADANGINGANGMDGIDGDEKERRSSEANQHIASYVTDQLERLRTNDSVFDEDEFEAQLE